MVNQYFTFYWDAVRCHYHQRHLCRCFHISSSMSDKKKVMNASVDGIILWQPDGKHQDFFFFSLRCNLNVSLFILLYIKVLFTLWSWAMSFRLVWLAFAIAVEVIAESEVKWTKPLVQNCCLNRRKKCDRRTICCHNFCKIIIWMAMEIKISLFLIQQQQQQVAGYMFRAYSLQQSHST